MALAAGTDLLLHEAIGFDWVQDDYKETDAATRTATIEHHRKSHTSPEDAGSLAAAAGPR